MVSMNQIQAFSHRIAEAYRPRQIVLFGSYADGRATKDSDVDLLVVLPFKGRSADIAVDMRLKLHPSFPVDLLVRTPQMVRRRLAMGDGFMQNILNKGRVLYETDRR